MRVNGTEVLACSYKPSDGDLVEPLRNAEVIRDLVVDMDRPLAFNTAAGAWIDPVSGTIRMGSADEKANALQSDCILCGSCVITSYSIHYTKLYENRPQGVGGGTPLRLRGAAAELAAAHRGPADPGRGAGAAQFLRVYADSRGAADRAVLGSGTALVITSYSIHYTKLYEYAGQIPLL